MSNNSLFHNIFLGSRKAFKKIQKSIATFIELKQNKSVTKKLKLPSEDSISIIDTIEKNKSEEIQYVHISTSSILMFCILAGLIGYVGYIVYAGLSVIYLIITGIIISIAMDSGIRSLSKFVSRGYAITLAYLIFFVFISLGFIVFVPLMISQGDILVRVLIDIFKHWQVILLNEGIDGFIQNFDWIPDFIATRISDGFVNLQLESTLQKSIQQNIGEIINIGQRYVPEIGNFFLGFFEKFISFIGQFSIVFIVAILSSIEKKGVANFLVRLGGKKNQSYWRIKIDLLYKKLGIWLKGQFLLCVIIGCTVRFATFVLGLFGMVIPNALSLALLAGLFEFIPYVGPVFGAIPAIIIATITYGWLGFFVMTGIFVLIQQLENNVLIPWMMNKTLGVSPIVTFVSMIMGWVAIGFLGVVLAIPLAVIVTIIFDEDYT